MTEDTSPIGERLYVYVKDWERHQDRPDRPGMVWSRLYSDLPHDDDWNGLSTADRCLLIGLWMDTNRLGNGRVSANLRSLRVRHNAHKSSLERLVQAGFITLSSAKAPAPIRQRSALEEKRLKEKKEKESSVAAAAASENGRAATPATDQETPTGARWRIGAESKPWEIGKAEANVKRLERILANSKEQLSWPAAERELAAAQKHLRQLETAHRNRSAHQAFKADPPIIKGMP